MRQYCVYSSVAAAESFLAPCRQPYHVSTRERHRTVGTLPRSNDLGPGQLKVMSMQTAGIIVFQAPEKVTEGVDEMNRAVFLTSLVLHAAWWQCIES